MKKKKTYIIIPLIIILIISILNMYNAKFLDKSYSFLYIKQIIWYVFGFILIFLSRYIHNEKIYRLSFILYIIGILLLILVLIFGKEINGARAWFSFKYFAFQPSELLKLILAILLSFYTSNYNFKKDSQIKYILSCIIITLIPSFLVFIEPDTGAIIFYFIILITIIWMSPIEKKWFIILISFIVLAGIIFLYFYFFKQDFLIKIIGTSFFYRIDRLINFYNNTGYQIENALISISNANFFGVGLNKILIYIPEGHTDFIFAYNCANFGILGCMLVILSFLWLDILLINTVSKLEYCNHLFAQAFTNVFLFQQFYNILMNLNLLPIMGIPLPFLSYGGSTIIIYFIFLAMILKQDTYQYG